MDQQKNKEQQGKDVIKKDLQSDSVGGSTPPSSSEMEKELLKKGKEGEQPKSSAGDEEKDITV